MYYWVSIYVEYPQFVTEHQIVESYKKLLPPGYKVNSTYDGDEGKGCDAAANQHPVAVSSAQDNKEHTKNYRDYTCYLNGSEDSLSLIKVYDSIIAYWDRGQFQWAGYREGVPPDKLPIVFFYFPIGKSRFRA